MRIPRKIRHKSVFRRLVLSFVCILLPIYVLSILVYNWGINTIRETTAQTMMTKVSYFLYELEDEVKRIQDLQFSMMHDPNLRRLSFIHDTLNDMDRAQAFINLQKNIRTIENSSSFIDRITIYIPMLEKNVSVFGPSTISRYESSLLAGIDRIFDSQIFSDGSEVYIYISDIRQNFESNGQNPLGFVILTKLSREKIEQGLKSMANIGDETLILYRPVDDFRISVNYNEKFGTDIQNRLSDADNRHNNDIKTISVDGEQYLSLFVNSQFLNTILSVYIPENSVFADLRRFRGWFVLFTFTALVVVLGYSLYLYKYINKPLKTLVSSFKQLERGDFQFRLDNKNDNEFGYIYGQFDAMLDKLNNLIDQVYKQKILMQKSEMKQLQAQINPHFLYNNFFTLRTMVQMGDYDNLERFADQLGEYFQFITRNSKDIITLEEEVNHARIYASIQAKRFSERLTVEFDNLPASLLRFLVPRLFLQPVIENAFEHGLRKKEQGGLLRVKFETLVDTVEITVKDNGDDISDEDVRDLNDMIKLDTDDSEVTGMINVYRRLRLKFGIKSDIVFERGNLNGLKVIIILPFTEAAECTSC